MQHRPKELSCVPLWVKSVCGDDSERHVDREGRGGQHHGYGELEAQQAGHHRCPGGSVHAAASCGHGSCRLLLLWVKYSSLISRSLYRILKVIYSLNTLKDVIILFYQKTLRSESSSKSIYVFQTKVHKNSFFGERNP